jgi:hypothetical protein
VMPGPGRCGFRGYAPKRFPWPSASSPAIR